MLVIIVLLVAVIVKRFCYRAENLLCESLNISIYYQGKIALF